jgi:hypothetical protein
MISQDEDRRSSQKPVWFYLLIPQLQLGGFEPEMDGAIWSPSTPDATPELGLSSRREVLNASNVSYQIGFVLERQNDREKTFSTVLPTGRNGEP